MTATASLGHNNPPVNFLYWTMRLMASNLLPAEKVVTLVAIVAQTGKIEEIARLSGIPARSVERARYRPARDGWLHISGAVGRGLRRTYMPGLPERGVPVPFDDSFNAKATRECVDLILTMPLQEPQEPTRGSGGKRAKATQCGVGSEKKPTQEMYAARTSAEVFTEKPTQEMYAARTSAEVFTEKPTQEMYAARTSAEVLDPIEPSRAHAHKESLRDTYTLVSGSEDSPLTPQAAPQSENDRLWREAMLHGHRTKGGASAKSARTAQRTTGELDGSQGIHLAAGKLMVANGAAAALLADFPGVNLQAVCDRAAPEVMRCNYPSFDQAMALLRKWARIVVSDARATPSQRRSGKGGDGTYRPSVSDLQDALNEIEGGGHPWPRR